MSRSYLGRIFDFFCGRYRGNFEYSGDEVAKVGSRRNSDGQVITKFGDAEFTEFACPDAEREILTRDKINPEFLKIADSVDEAMGWNKDRKE